MIHVRRALATLVTAPTLLVGSACSDSTHAFPDRAPTTPAGTLSSPHQSSKRETAEHFIRRWAEVERDMQNTGKTGAYLRLSRLCEACAALANDIERFYGDGGFVRWGGWKIMRIQPVGAHDGDSLYNLRVVSAPTTYRESSDSPPKRLEGDASTHQLTLRHRGESWILVRIMRVAQ